MVANRVEQIGARFTLAAQILRSGRTVQHLQGEAWKIARELAQHLVGRVAQRVMQTAGVVPRNGFRLLQLELRRPVVEQRGDARNVRAALLTHLRPRRKDDLLFLHATRRISCSSSATSRCQKARSANPGCGRTSAGETSVRSPKRTMSRSIVRGVPPPCAHASEGALDELKPREQRWRLEGGRDRDHLVQVRSLDSPAERCRFFHARRRDQLHTWHQRERVARCVQVRCSTPKVCAERDERDLSHASARRQPARSRAVRRLQHAAFARRRGTSSRHRRRAHALRALPPAVPGT